MGRCGKATRHLFCQSTAAGHDRTVIPKNKGRGVVPELANPEQDRAHPKTLRADKQSAQERVTGRRGDRRNTPTDRRAKSDANRRGCAMFRLRH